MPIDRKHIGVRTPPYSVDVENGQLRFFAKVTGESNPIYSDEAAARAAGHPALPAPPTFTFSLSLNAPTTLDELGVDLRHILHGEQSFVHHAQIYAGDRITLTGEVTDIYTKKDGALGFVVQRILATNQKNVLCTEMLVTTVVRNG